MTTQSQNPSLHHNITYEQSQIKPEIFCDENTSWYTLLPAKTEVQGDQPVDQGK
jgi:hypothetical protein